MLQEAFKYLFDRGRASVEVKTLALPGGQILVYDEKESQVYNSDPTPITDRLTTIEDLIKWAEDYAVEEGEPVVFVSADRVVINVYRETAHKMRLASCNLRRSPAWNALTGWMKADLPQAGVVKALRGPLANTFEPAILSIFRRLDFQRKNAAAGTVGHAKESLGRSVEALAQSSDGEIPERIKFTIPVVREFEHFAGVMVAVQVNASAETIGIYSEGSALEDATDGMVGQLTEYLRGMLPDYVSVYRAECH